MTNTVPSAEYEKINHFFDLALPKWPQMLVRGISVTPEQAEEIIRRTDSFFAMPFGNNRTYVKLLIKTLHMPEEDKGKTWRENFDETEKYLRNINFIDTEYVSNCWISSAFIHGPHGWCNPNGTIEFVDNIGKWPSVKEVYEEWIEIAKEFPYLDLDVVLMDREECEEGDPIPVVGFRIQNGNVDIRPGNSDDWFIRNGKTIQNTINRSISDAVSAFNNPMREHGIPFDTIKRWGNEYAEKFLK